MNSPWKAFLDRFNGSYTQQVLQEALNLFLLLWPYLVAGILLTSLLKFLLPKEKIALFFSRNRRISILLAALAGVVSPLGSYVVIPLSASLFLLGTPLPVLMALIVASPLIDPNLFILTAGVFGYPLAVARMASAFLLGSAAGYATQGLMHLGMIRDHTLLHKEAASVKIRNGSGSKESRPTFISGLVSMTLYISKYFFLALLLAALTKILLPAQVLLRFFNSRPLVSVFLSAAAGVPFYVCGGAAIPVIRELADLGLSTGAVLAFFIAGPVTKISNLLLVYAVYNFRILLVYLLTGLSGAIVFGLLYNIL